MQRDDPPQGGDRRRCSSRRTGPSSGPASCNTVVIEADGTRVGYNTDYRAAMDSLETAMGGSEDAEEASPLLDKQVLILGAGGVARSIAFGLMRRGAAPDDHQPPRRARHRAGRGGRLPDRSPGRSGPASIADVIVNCTPVGMHPNVDDTPLPPAAFPRPGMVVFDTVYHPENTMLLKLARERQAAGRHRRRHVRPPGGPPVQALHRARTPRSSVMRAALKRKLGPIREA